MDDNLISADQTIEEKSHDVTEKLPEREKSTLANEEGFVDEKELEEIARKNLTHAFNVCVGKVLTDSSKGIEKIAKCFSSNVKHKSNEDFVFEVTKLFTDIKAMVKNEFADFLEQSHLTLAIADLDKIISERIEKSKEGKTWRPSGNPEEDIRPHLYQQKLDFGSFLDQKLKKEEEEFAALKMEIKAKRQKVKDCYEKIHSITCGLDKECEKAQKFVDQCSNELTCTRDEILLTNDVQI